MDMIAHGGCVRACCLARGWLTSLEPSKGINAGASIAQSNHHQGLIYLSRTIKEHEDSGQGLTYLSEAIKEHEHNQEEDDG